MIIETTEVTILCDKPIVQSFAQKLRGFFGNYYENRFEFHHHLGEKLLYKHPLIQYKVVGGAAIIMGIGEGAYLLRVIDKFQEINLGGQTHKVIRQFAVPNQVDVGVGDVDVNYSFFTPWLALNEDNYKEYRRIDGSPDEVRQLANKILVGNLLSFSKSIGYTAEERIEVDFVFDRLHGAETVSVKNGTPMLAFKGSFKSNFHLPDLWGIGKFSSRGYGVVLERHRKTNQVSSLQDRHYYATSSNIMELVEANNA